MGSGAGKVCFALARLRLGVPSEDVFRALLTRFGLVMTSAGAAFSIGFAKLATAFTSVGIGVDESSDLVNAVSGSSNGGGASGCVLIVGTIGACAKGVPWAEEVVGSATGLPCMYRVSAGADAIYGAEYGCVTTLVFLESEATPLYAAAHISPTPKAKLDSSRSISNPIMSYLFLSRVHILTCNAMSNSFDQTR